MPQTRSLSHLEAVFDNEDIKEAVRKLKEAHEKDRRIYLPGDEVKLVQQAYRRAMSETEARTHVLVVSISGDYWSDPNAVRTSMSLEGVCSYRHHKNPIIVVEDLSREHFAVMMSTDEELTARITAEHKEIQTCKSHGAPVEVEKSLLVYTPYDFAMSFLGSRGVPLKEVQSQLKRLRGSTVLGVTSRIKSPGGLADKVTDKILGIDRIYRADKILGEDDEVNDLSGIKFITVNQQACYQVLEYLTGRRDITIVGQPKDYIKKPKDNKYRAIHLVVSYMGLRHEIQIVDAVMFDFNRSNPLAAHKKYRQAIREAREEIWGVWSPLNAQLRRLVGGKPKPLPQMPYER